MMLKSKTLNLFALPLLLALNATAALGACASAQHAQHQPGQHNKPAGERAPRATNTNTNWTSAASARWASRR